VTPGAVSFDTCVRPSREPVSGVAQGSGGCETNF
jgi:hypothetical protein